MTGMSRKTLFNAGKAQMTPKFPIHFAHIPKTGGTTLLYHFRTNLGDDRVFVFGPHGRQKRFFEGQFQLEELAPDGRAQIAVLQGHGVDQRALGLAPQGAARLILILRHPVEHARSAFNHMIGGRSGLGVNVTTEYFLEETEADIMARRILRLYPDFVAPEADGLLAQARSVLRCFDDVFLTNGLDGQIAPLMAYLGLPTAMERRRVAGEKVPLLMSDAEISARNAVDLELFKEALAGLPRNIAPGERHNPFGFEAERRHTVASAISDAYALDSATVYQELADAMCRDLRAEEALSIYERGEGLPVREADRFVEILRATWETEAQSLSAEQRAISRSKAGL